MIALHYILYFFVYSFLGWVCECLYCGIPQRRFINRGFLAGPYCPIYGWGALLVLYVLSPFRDHLLLLFAAGMILTSALEYITSFVMEKLFHSKWWDYSEQPFNLHGRICLKNTLLFGVMGVFVVRFAHPLIERGVAVLPLPLQIASAIVFSVVFLWDNVHTFHAILRENSDYRLFEDSLRQLGEKFRSVKLFPLEEPLSARVQRILDETDADERLLEALSRLQQQYQKRLDAFRHTRRRLQRAFPRKPDHIGFRNAGEFVKLLDDYRHKRDHLDAD